MEQTPQSMMEEITATCEKNRGLFQKLENMEELNRLEISIDNGKVCNIKKCKIEKEEWKKKLLDCETLIYPNINKGFDAIVFDTRPAKRSIETLNAHNESVHKWMQNLKTVLNDDAFLKYGAGGLKYLHAIRSVLNKEYKTMKVLNTGALELAESLFYSCGDNYAVYPICSICKEPVKNYACFMHTPQAPYSSMPQSSNTAEKWSEDELSKLTVPVLKEKCAAKGINLTAYDRKPEIIKKMLDFQESESK